LGRGWKIKGRKENRKEGLSAGKERKDKERKGVWEGRRGKKSLGGEPDLGPCVLGVCLFSRKEKKKPKLITSKGENFSLM